MHSRTLHARFRLAMLSISAVLAVVVGAVVYLSARSYYVETGGASARASVAAVEHTLAVGVYARDDVLLKELVKGLADNLSLSRVDVLDSNGKVLVVESSAADANQARRLDNRSLPTFSSVLRSPFNEQEKVGQLEVWLDSERLAAEARRQAGIVVGALIVLLGGFLLVFNSVARRLLSLPMHRLAAQLASLQPGATHRLTIGSLHAHDEVGIVTAAVNRLLELQQHALKREREMRQEIMTLEARYRGIFDSTSAGIFILSLGNQLIHSNPALSRLLGLDSDGQQHEQITDFVATSLVRPAQLAHLIEQARASLQPEALDIEMYRSDRTTLWAHCMVSCTTDAATGEPRVEGVLYDVTRRKLQEQSAQHHAEHDALTGLKNRAFIESALNQQVHNARIEQGAVSLMFIDLDGFKSVNDRWGHASGDAVLVEAANRLRALFQRGCDVVGRLGGDELVVMIVGVSANHPVIAELATRLIDSFREPFKLPNSESVLVGASVGVASYPLHSTNARTLIQAADAAMYAMKQSGKGGFVIAQTATPGPQEDAGEWQDDVRELVATSHLQRDPLTGLMDRKQLVEQLTKEHLRVMVGADPVGLICLDIDQFTMLNLAHGTQIGDEVLCEVARRLSAALRRGDVVARTGSDEFVVLLLADGGGTADAKRTAEAVARKLLDCLIPPFHMSSCTVTVHASAGGSVLDKVAGEGLDVLREAQLGLRRAKALGGRTVMFFEQEMMAGLQSRMALEEDLRAAMGTSQLYLHVQPQVDTLGALVGGEALLRWMHPVRGLVPPDQFIPLAESCGAIVELGAWVLRAGCEILVQMQAGNDGSGSGKTLAINISPMQFNHPNFVSEVQLALISSGARADGLILEITESLLIIDIQRVADRLRELVALGVRFSIDDFGTGFSSLAYLRQLPLHEIKIDRSFIAGLPNDVASAGIVGSILSMGSHLGLRVVAEGVETQEQADFLNERGCPVQQGWLYGRPIAAQDFLIASNPSA